MSAGDRLPSPVDNPKLCNKIAPWLLIVPSVIVGILLVELFCRLFCALPQNSESRLFQRVFFLDGHGEIFRNIGDIFTFIPNNEVHVFTAFFSDHDFTVEYDYNFRANNLGLVEDTDVVPERDSLLLLGDSFTEGLGAEPWFRLVSPEIDKLGYQAVNGGLRGAGFEEWVELDRYLAAQDVRIRKLVVVFISDDYRRPLADIKPDELQCISALSLCRPEKSYYFRLPPPEELSSWIAKIRASRAPMERSWLGARAAALLPESYHVYRYFRERFKGAASDPRLDRAEEQSRVAILALIGKYGPENVVFIHIPQKDETDGPSELGLRARRSIRDAGGRLFDGFKLCQMKPNDYYVNDDHPNRGGYAKIAGCVTDIIKETVAAAH
jgi:hypothetical protein